MRSIKRYAVFGGYRYVTRRYTTKTVTQEPDVGTEKEEVIPKPLPPLKKRPAKLPFIKNMFKGKFDTDVLTYPEFLDTQRMKNLDENAKIVRKLYDQRVDSRAIDASGEIPHDVLTVLKGLNLFGQKIPVKYGGLEFTHTEYARMMEELSRDLSLGMTLYAHEGMGCKPLLMFGNDFQKEKYLPKLACGEWIAALCLSEEHCKANLMKIDTWAEFQNDNTWRICGTKSWVTNAGMADFFTVFAKVLENGQPKVNEFYSNEDLDEPLRPSEVAVFLVEKNFGGIKLGPRMDLLGVRGLDVREVTFNNVIVPEENLLGSVSDGYKIGAHCFAEERYVSGCFAMAQLRDLVEKVTNHVIKRKVYDDSLKNYGLIQQRLGYIFTNMYAIESTLYRTTGLMDEYENPDCSVESNIVKVLSSELGWECVRSCLQMLGSLAYRRDLEYERYMRDLKILSLFDITDEMSRLYVSLMGLKYVSDDLNEVTIHVRNPFLYPSQSLKMQFKYIGHTSGVPKLYLKLYQYLHPSLVYLSDMMESCVVKFEYAVHDALGRNGPPVVYNQFILKRLSDCAIIIYSMVSVLSRASRAYCVGMQNNADEMVMAEIFVREKKKEFEEAIAGITQGPFYVNDVNLKNLSEKQCFFKKYSCMHPIVMNYD